MEKYLAAAERIAEEVDRHRSLAVCEDRSSDPRRTARRRHGADYDYRNARRWTIYSDGSVVRPISISAATGDYTLRVDARAQHAGDEPPQMELRLDGQKVKSFDVNASEQRGRYEIKWDVRRRRRIG